MTDFLAKEITSLLGEERAITRPLLDLILHINLWELCDISAVLQCLFPQLFLALRALGTVMCEFPRALLICAEDYLWEEL